MEDTSVNDIFESAAEVNKIANFFRHLKKLDAALQTLAVYEQTRIELKNAISGLQREILSLKDQRASLADALAAQQQKNDEEAVASGLLIKSASDKAAKMISDAQGAADAVVAAARASADKVTGDANDIVAKLRADADAIKAELNVESQKLADIKAAISKITGA